MAVKSYVVQGLKIALDPEKIVDDWELFELLALTQTDAYSIRTALVRILGDQYEKVKEHLRDEDGFISATAMLKFLEDLINNAVELKN